VYLSVLEAVKGAGGGLGHALGLRDTTVAGLSNFAGGAVASLATQSIVVPIDVVSQRQMMAGASGAASTSTASTPAPARPAAPRAPAVAPLPPLQAPVGSVAHAAARAAGTALPGARQLASLAVPPQLSERLASHASAGGSSSGVGGARAPAATAAGAGGRRGFASASAAAPGASSSSSGLSGLQMARLIVAQEGFAGLYKGFGVSVALFVPSSALWWGAYGAYQRAIWNVLYHPSAAAAASGGSEPPEAYSHAAWEVAAVQTSAAIAAGCTSGLLTTPLDLVKTRMQVARAGQAEDARFRGVLARLLREGGARGLFRGAVPRVMNAALWGTCMVSAYEFLKRTCVKPDDSLAQ